MLLCFCDSSQTRVSSLDYTAVSGQRQCFKHKYELIINRCFGTATLLLRYDSDLPLDSQLLGLMRGETLDDVINIHSKVTFQRHAYQVT